MKEGKKVRVTLRLNPSLHHALKVKAKAMNISLNRLIEMILEKE